MNERLTKFFLVYCGAGLLVLTVIVTVAVPTVLGFEVGGVGNEAYLEKMRRIREIRGFVPLSIGDTEFMESKVRNTLKYTDVLYGRFVDSESDLHIFITYWSPGRESPRSVAFHTPDNCWVKSGWKSIRVDDWKVPNDAQTSINSLEYRVFEKSGDSREAYFGQFLGGEKVDFGSSVPSNLSMLTELLHARGWVWRKQSQIFIRFDRREVVLAGHDELLINEVLGILFPVL